MQIDMDKFVEILANLFTEKQEIAMVIDGVKTVVGYTQPKTIVFDSDMVNVKKIPSNAIGYVKKEGGKTILKLVEVHPPSLVEKLLRGK
ncbi:hypothetical protein KEJ24_06075 [Candidatus Bathyarchaeota archaeon]|nr:hypothetical protein [Candidatus Bathyarchaeota archaeon]